MMRVVSIKAADKLIILESKERVDDFANQIQRQLDNKGYCNVDIIRDKRSLNANAYMWYLCTEIGKSVQETKDKIYRDAIKGVGVSTYMVMKETAYDDFVKRWQDNGTGWFVEKVGNNIMRGYIEVIAYYGSSTYDTKEMAQLIDKLVLDAEDLGIRTMTKEELQSLLKQWKVGEKQ